MRVKYNNGGPISEELRKKQIMSSLNQSQPTSTDPIQQRLDRERFAQQYTNMKEEAYDQYIIPDPRETGQVNPDRSYILEAAMLAGGLPRGGAKAAGQIATRGGVPEIDAARRASINAMSKRMGEKRMLNEQQKRIAEDRLQYISDRLLNEAKTEDMVSGLDLQGQLTDVLESAIKGEKDRVDEILGNFIQNEQAKRMAKDELNALAEMLSGRSGGEFSKRALDARLNDYLGMSNVSMTKHLANPGANKVAGYPRLPFDITSAASRNEYGGRVK